MDSIVITINDVVVEITSEAIYNRNRQETADFGALTIVSTRESRYEPFTRCTINSEQYLIESDNPLQLRDDLWEHKLTLIENIAICSTIFPVDRQFTSVPSKTIKEILLIYQRELGFYQDFLFEFDETDTIYNEKMINKQYQGVDFAVIVYDLFRKINSIPRVTWQNNKWYISYEKYTDRNTLLTINAEGRQSNVNDVDYATEILSKTRNALSEDGNGIWFPNKDYYITPRSKSTMLKTSDLQFELDSDISVVYQAIAKVDITYNYMVGPLVELGTATITVDYTNGIRLEEDYSSLEISSEANPLEQLQATERPTYKQNNIYYNSGKSTIEGLYWNKQGIVFTQNINALKNTITAYLNISAREQLGPSDDDYIDKSAELDINISPENIESRFYYRPSRDIAYVTEKYNIKGFNKATISNNQRDGSIELSRYMENSSAIANRIGNEIKNLTETFYVWADRWVKGDYITINDEYWIITNIKYVLDKTLIKCIADFTKGFSNINRETGITREPSAFVYTGKNIQSNFVYREYLVLYEGTTSKNSDSNLLVDAKRTIMNLFDYSDTYNTPLTNATFNRTGGGLYLDMPIYGVGGGNTIVMHMAFKDSRVGGYGLKKTNSAWYKNPVYYVDSDYELDSGSLVLSNDMNLIDDTDYTKWYPQVFRPLVDKVSILTFPFDKDVNDILAITYEIVVVSDSKNIIVPNGFAKFNNLIRYFDDMPEIEVYSNTESYTIFDKYVSGTLVTANVTLTTDSITVTDAIGESIEYWAIVHDGEIILAANNNVSVIKYIFTKNRRNYEIVGTISFDINMVNYFELTLTASKQRTITNPEFDSIFSLVVIADLIEIFKFGVEHSNLFSLEATYKILETFEYSCEFENNFSLTITSTLVEIFKFGAEMDNLFSLDLSIVLGTGVWEDSTLAAYTAATTKTAIMVNSTSTPLPTVTNLGDALKQTIYNLQSSNSVEYGGAGTQVDIGASSETITSGSSTATVEAVLQSYNPTQYAILVAGTMTDTVIKITDQNLTVTYWKADYSNIDYYLVEFEED